MEKKITEIEKLFNKHKETIFNGVNSGKGLRQICFGTEQAHNSEGDPQKIKPNCGGIQDFIDYAKATNTKLLDIGIALSDLIEQEINKRLEKFINNNPDKNNTNTGLVDERFELCSIIAQLAGIAGYTHDNKKSKRLIKLF